MSGVDMVPIVYATGEGSNVVDVDGNRYVDLVAGFGALPLGHRSVEVTRAVRAQEQRLWHGLGDVYASDVKVLLSEKLAGLFPEKGARVLLGLSGADAVTAALKSAMLATGKAGVVAFAGGYHGLSHGPLAACGLSEAFRAPFEGQLGHYVSFAPYPASEGELDRTLSVVEGLLASGGCGAVLVEPMLGRGGCIIPPPGFLPALRAACDRAGALLIVDEIWTGIGRTGAMFAFEVSGVVPDLVCVGKALGSGLPISACIGRASVMEAWRAHGGGALHTATHFGSPIACAAALATLEAVGRRKLSKRAGVVGQRWKKRLAVALDRHGVADLRGRGLMLGIELEGGPARALRATRALLERGFLALTGGSDGHTLTLTPSLTIDETLLAAFSDTLADVLRPSS